MTDLRRSACPGMVRYAKRADKNQFLPAFTVCEPVVFPQRHKNEALDPHQYQHKGL
jgi:hypothetical protein